MEWISVKNGNLPKKPYKDEWKRYIVRAVLNLPSIFEEEREVEIVTTALYDHKQKIWRLDDYMDINALYDNDGNPISKDFVSHWMTLPEPPDEMEENNEV